MAGMDHLAALLARHPALATVTSDVAAAFDLLRERVAGGGTVLACGNGGSAADSEHIVGELMKGFLLGRALPAADIERFETILPGEGRQLAAALQRAIPAIALTGSGALATAIANDTDPTMMFAQQLFGLGRAGDVLVAISTSGNSRNVLAAAKVARAMGVSVLGLTGRTGGKLALLCDVCIKVPADDVAAIQEYHLPVYHALCAMLEQHFFGDGVPAAAVAAPRQAGRPPLPLHPALLVFDFDGVFTDNKVWTAQDGAESVACDRRDGLGIDRLRDAGIPMFILSKETNPVVQARARKLRIDVAGGCDTKAAFLTRFMAERGIDPAGVVYMGNDINDLEAMAVVGHAVAPADAHPDVKHVASLVLSCRGGDGAVRELSDIIISKLEGR